MPEVAELIAALRPHVADERVLAAIAAVPRDAFVPRVRRGGAWENRALSIPCGQSISQPLVVARMAELLALEPGERVLDVGTGSGYHAAVLAALGGAGGLDRASPAAVARRGAGAGSARATDGVTLVIGDGALGLPDARAVRRDKRRRGQPRRRPSTCSPSSSGPAAGSWPRWPASASASCASGAR